MKTSISNPLAAQDSWNFPHITDEVQKRTPQPLQQCFLLSSDRFSLHIMWKMLQSHIIKYWKLILKNKNYTQVWIRTSSSYFSTYWASWAILVGTLDMLSLRSHSARRVRERERAAAAESLNHAWAKFSWIKTAFNSTWMKYIFNIGFNSSCFSFSLLRRRQLISIFYYSLFALHGFSYFPARLASDMQRFFWLL